MSLRLVDHHEKHSPQHADLQEGQYVLLTVQDTGHGMTPEILEQIFDPFFTTKEKSDAAGMGIRAFIVKPLLIQDLAKTIRKVLDDNEFRD